LIDVHNSGLWEEKCDEQGSCLEYQSDTFRRNLVLLGIFPKIASFIFFFLAWWFYADTAEANLRPGSVIKDSKKSKVHPGSMVKVDKLPRPEMLEEGVVPRKASADVHTPRGSEEKKKSGIDPSSSQLATD